MIGSLVGSGNAKPATVHLLAVGTLARTRSLIFFDTL
jgi:hypothetical protein